MIDNNLNKIRKNLDEKIIRSNLSFVIFSNSESINYLTNYTSPYEGSPLFLLIKPEEDPLLICAKTEYEDVKVKTFISEIVSYANYDYLKPFKPYREALGIIKDYISSFDTKALNIGVEKKCLLSFASHSTGFLLYFADELKKVFPKLVFTDISEFLLDYRKIKNDYEIEKIKFSCKINDIGQKTFKNCLKPNMSEIDIFSRCFSNMQSESGFRISIAGDLVVGRNEYIGEGQPGNLKIKEGDFALFDCVSCVDGYWSDTCSVTKLGKLSREERENYKLVKDTLYFGIGLLRPGIRACDIDKKVRSFLDKHNFLYEHHTGHGIGLSHFESPLIVPCNEEIILPGMIVCLEPGIYIKGKYSIRLEHVVLVTNGDPIVLTSHEL